MVRIAVFFIFLSVIAPMEAAIAAVHLNSTIKRYDLGLFSDYLEDKTGDLSLEDVTSSSYAHRWESNTSPTPNFAFSKSVYWLRLNFHSEFPENTSWLFEIAFPLQDYVDYYVVENGTLLNEVNTGDRRPFSTRGIDYRNFLFPLDIPANGERQVYIRLDTADGLHEPCPLILWDSQEFALQHGERNLGLGLYFGIMLVMALYNLFVYSSMGDKTYIYYVTYILGFSFWLFSYYGFSYQYLWPNSPIIGNLSTVVLTSFWAIFVAQFVRSFLDSSKNLPWFDKLMQAYIASMILTIMASFYGNYSFGILMVIGFGIPACAAGIVAGLSSWKAGYRPARFFLLAWSTLLVSLCIFCLKIAGLLPTIWVIERSVQIGSAIEVILLSLGLADRINSLKREKITAQLESIKSFESNLKLKNDFITSISHELRTPMNAILGGIEVATESDCKDFGEPLKIIRSGANDMMNLVDDILIHTELQSGQLTVVNENAHVRTALNKINDYYGDLCKERGLDFHYELDSNVPDWIATDKRKLTVILTKLLDNAVKFTEKGKIKLKISVDNNAHPPLLLCAVFDTGPGIPKDHQSLIFDPFVQIEGGFTRRHGGMGIGLSICRRLAEALQGTLTLESIVGEGSQFTLSFPLQVGVPTEELPASEGAPSDLPILVIEDNVVNQRVIVKILQKLGLTSLVANHGQEALEILESNAVSLILMDLQMPVMDGFRCTKTIRESSWAYKKIPIIAVTANVMDQDKARCKDVGMNDFLEKPLKLNVLRDCLAQYIKLEAHQPHAQTIAPNSVVQ